MKLRRAAVVGIYDVRETTVILAPDGSVHELSGPSAELARAVLAFALEPRSHAEIVAHVESLSGGPLPDTRVVDELLALFERAKVLVAAAQVEPPRPTHPRTRAVLALCGAVASSLAPSLVSLLQQRGFELRVVATESALRFVQAEVLAALVHHPVRSSLWPEDPALPVPHINLAQWADVVFDLAGNGDHDLRLATGDYSTLVSAVALATRAPVVVVPSMNVEMYGQPAVQRNLAQLVADGMHVVHPGTGGELALRPDARSPALGPTPPHTVVAGLLETVVALARARRTRARVGPPRDADEWDELFRTHEDHELAWHSEALDDDLAVVLEREAAAGLALLDIGTGLGVAALAAARLGYRVVTTDVSETALARARDRARSSGSESSIVWLRDDITNSRLHGEFAVVLDRGCLHLLAPERLDAYARALARLTTPGGVLVLKTHALSEGESRATSPYDATRIERLFGNWFMLESDAPSTFPGTFPNTFPTIARAPSARLFLLRRAILFPA